MYEEGCFTMRLLKENDIKPVLRLATNATKELVISGVNGEEDFPELLSRYKFRGTRDYNMALIVVAFYTYCMKSDDSEIKRFASDALRQGSNSNKLFKYLKEGDGKKVKDCMKFNLMIVMDKVLQKVENLDKIKRARVVEDFRNQAGKITPWLINAKDVGDLIDKLLNKQKDQHLDEAMQAAQELFNEAEKEAEAVADDQRFYNNINELEKLTERLKNMQEKKRSKKSAPSDIVKPKEDSEHKNEHDTVRKVAEEARKAEEESMVIDSVLKNFSLVLQSCSDSLDWGHLDQVAANFSALRAYLGDEKYRSRLQDILSACYDKLTNLSPERRQALFSNIINITAEKCDGNAYFKYYVDGQERVKELNNALGVTIGELVNFDSLKNKCPIAIACNVRDHNKATELLVKEYEIPNWLSFLPGIYFSKNGPKKADFSSDWLFKATTWKTLSTCRYVILSYNLMTCLSDLNIITKK